MWSFIFHSQRLFTRSIGLTQYCSNPWPSPIFLSLISLIYHDWRSIVPSNLWYKREGLQTILLSFIYFYCFLNLSCVVVRFLLLFKNLIPFDHLLNIDWIVLTRPSLYFVPQWFGTPDIPKSEPPWTTTTFFSLYSLQTGVDPYDQVLDAFKLRQLLF